MNDSDQPDDGNLLSVLRCPECGSELDLRRFDEANGVFECTGTCGASWPHIGGIPRFVETDLLVTATSYQRYLEEYERELADLGVEFEQPSPSDEDQSASLEQHTNDYFGHSWAEGAAWGWIDESDVPEGERLQFKGGTIQATESAWNSKALMSRADVAPDKLILDAGCGNGRFSEMAARDGATVVSVDIGTPTVETAYENLDGRENVHVVQGNLFELPFAAESFDTAFSIGVLHHTGDARRAFESVADCVRDGGVLTVTVYHKLNPVWMVVNAALRSWSTDLSIEEGERFARRLARIARVVHNVHPMLLHGLNLLFRIQPTERHMFDWYSAPVASFHTYSEVERWFLEQGFTIVNSNKPADYDDRLLLKPWAATVKGAKSDEAGSGGFYPYFE